MVWEHTYIHIIYIHRNKFIFFCGPSHIAVSNYRTQTNAIFIVNRRWSMSVEFTRAMTVLVFDRVGGQLEVTLSIPSKYPFLWTFSIRSVVGDSCC